MKHVDTHQQRWPAYVLTSRPAPRRPRRGLLIAIAAMTASAIAGLHGGASSSGVQGPPAPGSGALEAAALARMTLPLARPPAASTTGQLPASHGDRARPVRFLSTTGDSRIPDTALAAYQRAAAERASLSPTCHLPWTLLAAIGKVESDHAGGGELTSDGTTPTPILGPELNGSGVAAMPDPDSSAPGHTAWLRAIGPMQLLPTTWKQWAVSARPGAEPDPNNIFDAAATAGAYLCDDDRDLTEPQELSEAVLAYNQSSQYLLGVLSWVLRYSSADPGLVLPDGLPMPRPCSRERTGDSEAKPPKRHTPTGRPGHPVPGPRPAAPPSIPSPRPVVVPQPTVPAARPSPQPSPTVPSQTPSASPSPSLPPTASAAATPAPSPSPSSAATRTR